MSKTNKLMLKKFADLKVVYSKKILIIIGICFQSCIAVLGGVLITKHLYTCQNWILRQLDSNPRLCT